MLPDLSILLNYKHEKVIQSFIRTYDIQENIAIELFEDVLRYLWIAKKHDLDKKQYPREEAYQFQFVMHEEMREIDNMWHNFILYTHDYTEFCHTYFGEYLHHVPDIAETTTQSADEFSADLEKYLSYVYDNLDETTVHRWFGMHIPQSVNI